MHQSKDCYPTLASLISGWFHQDFDIEGETVKEILNAYNRTSSDEERELLVEEITCFIDTNKDELDETFVRTFKPDIEVAGFATSTEAFLEEIKLYVIGENRD